MADIFAVKHGITGYVGRTGSRAEYLNLHLVGTDAEGRPFELHLNTQGGGLDPILNELRATGAIEILDVENIQA